MCIKEFSINLYIEALTKEVNYFTIFSVFALLTPFLSCFLAFFWLPTDDSIGTWFQRSGSIMAVFGLLAEARAVNCFFILNPSGFGSTSLDEAIEKYDKYPKTLNLVSFFIIAIGTFIWGYGDIPFKYT
jgi:hypothetical protein